MKLFEHVHILHPVVLIQVSSPEGVLNKVRTVTRHDPVDAQRDSETHDEEDQEQVAHPAIINRPKETTNGRYQREKANDTKYNWHDPYHGIWRERENSTSLVAQLLRTHQ